MKGVFFTLITFIIFIGIVAYLFTITSSNIERGQLATERISAERVYYTWMSVRDHLEELANVSVGRSDSTIEINDTLPSEIDIKNFLWAYGKFVEDYYDDETIDIRFEDASGNPIDLNQTDPQIVIKPMNINYSWPTWGKKEVDIKVDPSNFSHIENLDLYIKLKNVEFRCNVSEPGSCDDWNPDNHVPNCDGVEYCLTLNLTLEDMNDVVFNFPQKYFDIDNSPSRKSTANIDVKNDTTPSFFIKIHAGPLPQVLLTELKDVKVDTYTKLKLDTVEFYINWAVILNVTTPFGKRVGSL